MEIIKEWFIGNIGSNPVVHGLIGGIVITLLNTIGALAILFVKRVSDKFLDASLGFSAGVMLVASFTALFYRASSITGSGR